MIMTASDHVLDDVQCVHSSMREVACVFCQVYHRKGAKDQQKQKAHSRNRVACGVFEALLDAPVLGDTVV